MPAAGAVIRSSAVIASERPRHRSLALAVALVLSVATGAPGVPPGSPARAAGDPLWTDAGVYRVYQRQTPLGREEFEFMARHDSLLVFSHVYEALPNRGEVDSLEKHAALTLAIADHDLRDYQSIQVLNGRRYKRYLSVDGFLPQA